MYMMRQEIRLSRVVLRDVPRSSAPERSEGVKGFDLDELGTSGMPRTQGRPR